MRVHITDLLVGDRLSSKVFNSRGLHVLSAETVLKQENIFNLFNHNIDYVEIFPREQGEPTVIRSSQVTSILQNIQPKFDQAVDGVKELYEQVEKEGIIKEEQVEASFNPLIQNFKYEKDVVTLLLTLISTDDYTYHHSVQVGMISYYLAKWMGKPEQEALFIGKAGYLQDIGKSMIDPALLSKPDKLNDEEFEIVKNHTIHGYDIINKSMNNVALALTALQHHERLNGTGYPYGMYGKDLHPISKITAVADVFCAMISSRAYQKERDLLYVLKELHRLSFGELDPFAAQAFIKNMIPSFIGKKLLLKNGETGHIIMTNPTDFSHPLICIDERFIDLSQQRHLEIDKIYMY